MKQENQTGGAVSQGLLKKLEGDHAGNGRYQNMDTRE